MMVELAGCSSKRMRNCLALDYKTDSSLVADERADTVVPPAVAIIEVGVLLVDVRLALAARVPKRGSVGVSARQEGR
jgi:hypothetical protein